MQIFFPPCPGLFPLPCQHWGRICGLWVHAKEQKTVPAVLGIQPRRKETTAPIYILTAGVTWNKKMQEYLGSDPKSNSSGKVCVNHQGAAWEGCLMYSWCHIPWGVCSVLLGYSMCNAVLLWGQYRDYLWGEPSVQSIAGYMPLSVRQ